MQVLGDRHLGQPVQAEVDHVPARPSSTVCLVEEGHGRRGGEGLPAGCGEGDLGDALDVRSDVVLVHHSWRAGVHADPHPQAGCTDGVALGERPVHGGCGPEGVDRAGERGEQPLAVGGDGQAVVRRAGRPHEVRWASTVSP